MRHIIAFVLIAFTWTQFRCTSNDSFDENEEAAVYRACIQNYVNKAKAFSDYIFKGKPFSVIVVSEKTSGFIIPMSYQKSISDLSPKPEKTTIRNFLKRNDGEYPRSQLDEKALMVIGRYPINPHIGFTLPHVLLSDQERDQIFKDSPDGGWNDFFRRYPTSRGIVFLSRVGFNRNMTQALLYFTFAYGSGAAEGYLILFDKQANQWKEIARTLVWIS
jgi:hypothetical protein